MNSKTQSIVVAGLLAILAGCQYDGNNGPGGGVPGGGGGGGGGGGTSPAAAIALTATPSTILTSGTSVLQATVTTTTGSNVPDGTSVTFILSSSTMGTLSTASASTSSGLASTTFTAAAIPGSLTVIAISGSAVSPATLVTIAAPATGAIVFVSATPQTIGVRGSGQAETSTVRFSVRDITGNPVVDGTTVSFTMAGPSGGRDPALGGEYIGTDDGTPTTATASTAAGAASVILNSGSIAGTVTVSASVVTPTGTASASSSVISIGGAIPSAAHFSLATTRLNLPGLVIVNAQATISAYIADRFGNYNILTGTTVSFYTEAGAIDANNTVGASGSTSVVFRTQAPMPVFAAGTTNGSITPAEQAVITALNTTYGLALPTDGSVLPRNGWVKVLATVNGEESFTDTNGNGLYDSGVDVHADLGEPYIDRNDNGQRDADEFFVDANNSGGYDGPNGVWDGPGCTGALCQQTKMIWTTHRLAFTGHAGYCAIAPNGPFPAFAISNGNQQSFSLMVGDQNLNRLVPGTTIAVTATKGTLVGQTNYTVPDGVGGPTQISFTLIDPDADTTVESATINFVVTPAEGLVGCQGWIIGTIE